MAEAQAQEGSRSQRRPRSRARVKRQQRRGGLRWGLSRGVFGLFALVALGLLAAGLLAARFTIFASNGPPAHRAARLAPSTTPAASVPIGSPVDGTILAVSVAQSLIGIQPASGSPVEATVTATSKLTRGGRPATLGSLIPGEAVIVTFAVGPHQTLVVAELQDIESVPTNTPSPSYAAYAPPPYYPSSAPTPKHKKDHKSKLTPPPIGPSAPPPASPSSAPSPG